MTTDNTQASETAGTEPQIPKSRFDEAVQNERAKAEAAATAQAEAETRAREAEVRWQEIQQTLETRLPPPPEPKPPEDEWVDPAEKLGREALRRAQEAESRMLKMEQAQQARDGAQMIQWSVGQHEFEDAADVQSRLQNEWMVSRATGQQFDAAARAKELYANETKRAAGRETARLEQKKRDEEATSSAMTGGGSPPIAPMDTLGDMPSFGTPERKKWDADAEAAILRQHGFGG